MTNHEDLQNLVAAYALDALDPSEEHQVESHLEGCPTCRDQLQSYREVMGLVAYEAEEAPAGLWDRIAGTIHESDASMTVPPLRPVVAGGEAAAAQQAGHPMSRSRRRLLAAVAITLAAAAVVVIAILGIQVSHLEDRTSRLNQQLASLPGQPSLALVEQALAVPGAQRVTLRSPNGGAVSVEAVILPSGVGYLYESRLSPLPSSETYQLWGVVGKEKISYALLGSAPATVTTFRAGPNFQDLAVTAEVAGGVVVTSQTPVVVGAT
jgi:anti-sigma factor RsiW